MKAIVYDRPGRFDLRDVPVPSYGADDVLLRVSAAGVCGTDTHLHDGEFGPRYPLIPGHEIAGEVVALGRQVTGISLGDLVTLDNTEACGECRECRRALPAQCRNIVQQGVNAPGGFAEYVSAPGRRCYVVNDLTPDVAVFAEPVACAVHALDFLGLQPGARVLQFGAGPSGLILVQLLRASGAGSLTVAAPTQFKLDLAATMGADRTVVINRSCSDEPADILGRLAGSGFDVIVDATGALNVLERSLTLLAVGGLLFLYGMTRESAALSVSPYDIFRRELVIKGTFAQQFCFDRAVEALRSGRVDPSSLITHRFDLEHYADALEAVRDSSSIKAVVTP